MVTYLQWSLKQTIYQKICLDIFMYLKDDTMIKDKHNNSTQYKCYHSLIPVVVVKVYYKDFENYFLRINAPKSR